MACTANEASNAKQEISTEAYSQNKQLALHVIKAHDAEVSGLIALTTFVSVYEFNDKTSRWGRANVEGFLFLIQRRSPPLYRLIVLNQKNQHNLVENIDNTWEVTDEANYIFYRRGDPEFSRGMMTRGLWFHDDAERRRIRVHLKKIINDLKAEAKSMEKRGSNNKGSATEGGGSSGGESGDEVSETMVADLLRNIITSK